MKIYNISVPKKYTQNGAEKTAWNNVGKLVKFDATPDKPEGFILELSMFPETKFGVFEQVPKAPAPSANVPQGDGYYPVPPPTPTEDIPF